MATSFDTTLANLSIGRTSTGTTVQNAASTTLGQADFLKLLTAQMKNQDPFDPVDNTEMVAQMAQFSSLAGISEMSSTLKSIAEKLGTASASDAMAYIGRTVLTPGAVAYARESGGVAGAVELGGAASAVSVTISDANGAVLKRLELGAQVGGTVAYDWDGTTDAGEDAGAGPFSVVVSAQNAGKAVIAANLVWAPVASVSTTSGTATLSLPGIGDVPVTAVRQIG